MFNFGKGDLKIIDLIYEYVYYIKDILGICIDLENVCYLYNVIV